MDTKGNGNSHGNSFANGNSTYNGSGLPPVRAKDWQFMAYVIGARVTIYDLM
jgi:hypothetical protein